MKNVDKKVPPNMMESVERPNEDVKAIKLWVLVAAKTLIEY